MSFENAFAVSSDHSVTLGDDLRHEPIPSEGIALPEVLPSPIDGRDESQESSPQRPADYRRLLTAQEQEDVLRQAFVDKIGRWLQADGTGSRDAEIAVSEAVASNVRWATCARLMARFYLAAGFITEERYDERMMVLGASALDL